MQKILAITYAIDSFRILIISKKEIFIRTDCEAIVKFYKLKNEKRSSQRRWLNFTERIINTCVKIEIERIKGKDNNLADSLTHPHPLLAAGVPVTPQKSLAVTSND